MDIFQFSGKIRHNVCAGKEKEGEDPSIFSHQRGNCAQFVCQSVPARYHTGFEFAVLRLGLPGKRGTI